MRDPMQQWEPSLPPERTAQIRAALLKEIGPRPPARKRWRLSGAALAAVGVLAVSGTAAAWVGVLRPDEPNMGYCSPTATLDREVWMHNGFGIEDLPDGQPGTVDGLEVCGLMWRTGMVQDPEGHPIEAPLIAPMDSGGSPPLTACVVEGFLVVYPGDERTCQRLGVPQAAAGR